MTSSGDFREFVRLFRHFWAANPGRSSLIVLAITAAALMEGLGIAALLPLISLAIDPDGAGSALGFYVMQAFALAGLKASIGGLLTLIVLVLAFKSLLMMLAMAQVGYSVEHIAMSQRLTLIRGLLDARWRHFVDQQAGHLASAVSIEPTRTAEAYRSSCIVLANVFQVLIYSGLSLAISWEVSVAALVAGATGMALLNQLVAMGRRAGLEQTERQKSLMTRLLQGLDGMKPLKAMAREGNLEPLLEADVRGLARARRVVIVSRTALQESHELLRALAVAGGLYFFLTIWDQPVDALLVLALIFARTLQKVSQIQANYQYAAIQQPAFAFLRSTIAAADQARESDLSGKPPRFDSAISLRDVSYSYGRENVLDRVSMVLPAGKFVAVVGPSGAGKTTVADLIIGLLRPQRGDVWIDDAPMRDIDVKAWRKMIGYVPQETLLFHDTIRANLTLGDPGISPVRVERALRQAEAWDFVAALPEGMDSVVGERGGRLSGGQRQRIAIARALICDPALLIFDEATTALDPDTEAGIISTVRQLTDKLTVLSISHQPAMKEAADVVYRLDNGRVSLEGPGEAAPVRMAGVS